MTNMTKIPETECPECGSKQFTRKGFDYCRKGAKQKFQCSECRRYFRDSITEEQKETIRNEPTGKNQEE